ncbi:endo-1,4-beta-xylanase [Nocardioides sp.]|uniref:endo-1,4-beta-xylanase n=1 Tax=Nocardioides sp. TaxID=35761 RepID=UPI003514B4F9
MISMTTAALMLMTLCSPAARADERADASSRSVGVAAPRQGYGFTGGTPILALNDEALSRQLDAVVAAGSRWLRMPINWVVAEPHRGERDWSRMDRVVRAARARGLTVLGVLGSTPDWARSSGTPASPPDDPRDFRRFAKAAARHFKQDVRHWEVWNEPNHSSFFDGTVEEYAELLKLAHRAITRVQHRATIVVGGLARSSLGQSSAPADFVEELYAAGARGHFDGVGAHPYLNAATAIFDEDRVWGEVEDARKVMRRNGDRKLKIWITEIGWSTWIGGWTQDRAADQALSLLQRAHDLRWVGMVVMYTIQDRGTNPLQVHENYGALLTADGSPKELFVRLSDGATASE